MSRSGEVITAIRPAPASRAAMIGHDTSARPQTGCSTFGHRGPHAGSLPRGHDQDGRSAHRVASYSRSADRVESRLGRLNGDQSAVRRIVSSPSARLTLDHPFRGGVVGSTSGFGPESGGSSPPPGATLPLPRRARPSCPALRRAAGGLDAEDAHRLQAEAELLAALGGAQVVAAELADALEPVADRVAVGEEGLGGRGDVAVVVEVGLDGGDQLGLVLLVVGGQRRDGLVEEALELGRVLAQRRQQQPVGARLLEGERRAVLRLADVGGQQRLLAGPVELRRRRRRGG